MCTKCTCTVSLTHVHVCTVRYRTLTSTLSVNGEPVFHSIIDSSIIFSSCIKPAVKYGLQGDNEQLNMCITETWNGLKEDQPYTCRPLKD